MTRRDELHNRDWTCPRCITDPGHDGQHECPECRTPDTPDEYITRDTGHCSSCGLVYSVSTHPEVEEDLFQVYHDVGEGLERDVRDVMEAVQTDDHDLTDLDELVRQLVEIAVTVEQARYDLTPDDDSHRPRVRVRRVLDQDADVADWSACDYTQHTRRAREHYACLECGCLFSRSPDTYQQRVALANAEQSRWVTTVLKFVEEHVDLIDEVRDRLPDL